jgi:VWFA-related protein
MIAGPQNRVFAIWVSLALGLGALTSLAQKTPNDDPIKVRTTLVSVPAVVSDRAERYIAGLKAADFRLYEDGIEQQISFFEATEEPLNVAVLVDTSLSTRPVLDDIKRAAKDFIKELRPKDRAMILSFDRDVHPLSSLTSDRKVLDQAIKNAEIGQRAGTVLRDAVAEVVNREFKGVSGRKAIVVLTDGKDHGSRVTEDELMDEASESGAMIHSLYSTTRLIRNSGGRARLGRWGRPFPRARGDVPGGRRRDRMERRNDDAREFLGELADVSAGRFYESELTDLKSTFKLIAEELRHQYQLGFYPDGSKLDGKVHTLRVQVLRPDLAVRARRTYTAIRGE